MGAALAPWEGRIDPTAAHPPVGIIRSPGLVGPYPYRTWEETSRNLGV